MVKKNRSTEKMENEKSFVQGVNKNEGSGCNSNAEED